MARFHDILYVAFDPKSEAEGLKQAFSVARNNETGLRVLLTCPDLPAALAEHRDTFRQSLIEALEGTVRSVREELGLADGQVPLEIDAASGPAPAVTIIQQVLRGGHGLLLKEADSGVGGRGFRAVDMELLRKCPCPVWLARPISRKRKEIRVAVAVDPEARNRAEHDLALQLLELGCSLADAGSGELDVVSCWSCAHEKGLRGNPWIRVSEEELERMLAEAVDEHRRLLDAMIDEAGIGGHRHVHHLRGRPEVEIPAFVEEHGVDILVMGTLGRTGIPGFVIGNTAENIIQQVPCSLLALKPRGFVSPVKAY